MLVDIFLKGAGGENRCKSVILSFLGFCLTVTVHAAMSGSKNQNQLPTGTQAESPSSPKRSMVVDRSARKRSGATSVDPEEFGIDPPTVVFGRVISPRRKAVVERVEALEQMRCVMLGASAHYCVVDHRSKVQINPDKKKIQISESLMPASLLEASKSVDDKDLIFKTQSGDFGEDLNDSQRELAAIVDKAMQTLSLESAETLPHFNSVEDTMRYAMTKDHMNRFAGLDLRVDTMREMFIKEHGGVMSLDINFFMDYQSLYSRFVHERPFTAAEVLRLNDLGPPEESVLPWTFDESVAKIMRKMSPRFSSLQVVSCNRKCGNREISICFGVLHADTDDEIVSNVTANIDPRESNLTINIFGEELVMMWVPVDVTDEVLRALSPVVKEFNVAKRDVETGEFHYQGFWDRVKPKVDVTVGVNEALGERMQGFESAMREATERLPDFSRWTDIFSSPGSVFSTWGPPVILALGRIYCFYRISRAVYKKDGHTILHWCGIWSLLETFARTTSNFGSDSAYPVLQASWTEFSAIVHSIKQRASDKVSISAPADFHFQALEPDNLNSKVASILLSVVSLHSIKKAPSDKQVEKFVNLASKIPSAGTGTAQIWDNLVEITQKAVNFVRVECLGLKPYLLAQTNEPVVEVWSQKVQKLYDESKVFGKGLIVNMANAARVEQLYKEGNEFLLGKYHLAESSRIRTAVNAYMQVLKALKQPFDHANISGIAPRMEPVTILLPGSSGVGKSNLTHYLLMDVLSRILPPERLDEFEVNPNDFIYVRKPENEYWEDYRSQTAMVIDDFAQIRDQPGNGDSEAMDIIRCTNRFPNVLHCADIMSKGNTIFRSEIILCTSNQTSFQPNSIIESEALLRRFNLVYRVVPKKEYCTDDTQDSADIESRRLDRNSPLIKSSGVDIDVYEFYELVMTNQTTFSKTGRVLSYYELVDRIVQSHSERSRQADAHAADISKVIKDGLHKRKEGKFESQAGFYDLSTGTVSESLPGVKEDVQMEEVGLGFDQEVNVTESSVPRTFCRKDFSPVKPILPMLYRATTNYDQRKYRSWLKRIGKKNNPIGFDYFKAICAYLPIYSEGLRNLTDTRRVFILSQVLPELDVLLMDREIGWESCLEYVQEASSLGPWDEICEDLQIRSKVILEGFKDSTFQKALTTFAEWKVYLCRKAYELVESYPILKWMAVGVGLFGAAYGLYKIFQKMYKKFFSSEEVFEGQSVHPKGRGAKIVPAKPKPVAWTWQGGMDEAQWSAQGGGDQNALELINTLARKSLYGIYTAEDEKDPIGYLFVLKGRIALYPAHYVNIVRTQVVEGRRTDESYIYLKNQFMESGYKIRIKEFLDVRANQWCKDQDLVAVVLPLNVHQHPDSSKWFVWKAEFDKPLDLTVHLVVPIREQTLQIYTGKAFVREGQKISSNGEGVIKHGFRYTFPTRRGQCGAPLVLNNRSVGPGKILGFHTCGDGIMQGLSSSVTREDVVELLKMFTISEEMCPPEEITFEPQCELKPYSGNFVPLNRVSRKVRMPTQTHIIPSPLFEMWGKSTTAPAFLTKVDTPQGVLDPVARGLSGYGQPDFRVDEETLSMVGDSLVSEYLNVASDMGFPKARVFDFDTAVQGDVSLEYCDPIDRKTSSGYPWNQTPGVKTGKYYWLGYDDKYDLANDRIQVLRNRCKDIIDEARRGRRKLHIFLDFPKDERKKLKKLLKYETRSISASPFDYTIVCRMYFLHFCMFLMSARLRTHSCVGINPNTEWDMLAKDLLKFANVVAGDYSGFDKRQLIAFLLCALRIINAWYNDGNDLIREVLFSEVYNSIHLFRGDLIQWLKCLPSGHILTVILNSLVNEMQVRYCWCLLNPLGKRGLVFFKDHVVSRNYGDDGILSISNEAIVFFNQKTISEAMATFGMIYTMENKEDDLVPSRSLIECTFLKRSFRFDQRVGKYVGPLDLDVILDIPYWTKKGASEVEITKSNVLDAMGELSLHPQATFGKWAPSILLSCQRELGYTPEPFSYGALQDRQLNMEWIY